MPTNSLIYANQTDSDGNIQHYKIQATQFGLGSYLAPDYSLTDPNNLDSFYPKIIWERQILKPYDELTHEERLDTLHTECGKLFQQTLDNCYRYASETDTCHMVYHANHYNYCRDIYDNTPISRDECRRFHYLYISFWRNLNDSDEVHYQLPFHLGSAAYTKKYCSIG